MPFVSDPTWQDLGEAVATGDRVAAAMLLDRARDDASRHLPPWRGKLVKGAPMWLWDASRKAILRCNINGSTAPGLDYLVRLAATFGVPATREVFENLLRWNTPGTGGGHGAAYFRVEGFDAARDTQVGALCVVCVLARVLRREAFLAYRADEGGRVFPFLIGWRSERVEPFELGASGDRLRLMRWTDGEDE